MAKYVPITKSEFERELRLIEKELELAHPFEILPLDGTAEYVYATRVYSPTKRVRPLSLRVYSSIVATKARGVGQDAIRVEVMTYKRLVPSPAWQVVLALKNDVEKQRAALEAFKASKAPKWVPERLYPAVKGKRVHRVEGWRKNLRTRIAQVIKEIY